MIKNIITFLFVCISTSLFATTYTASTGTWSSLTWSPAGPPVASDDIIIPTGVTVTMDADYTTSATLTLQGTGTIEMAGYNLTVGSLTAAGAAVINNGGAVAILSVGSLNTSTTYTGILTGAVSLTKSGSGTLALSGSNAFTGAITITNSGSNTLTFSGSNTFGGNITVSNSGSSHIYFNTGTNTFSGTVTSSTSSSGTNYFSNSGSSSFAENFIVNCSSTGATNFGNSGGSTTLAEFKTITSSTYSGSGTLYFRNFTQTGTGTAQTLNLSTTGNVTFFTGNTFNSALTVVAKSIVLSGTTFNGNVDFTHNGSTGSTGSGGNTYNGTVNITNSGSSSIIMNQAADIFNGDLTITISGTGHVYLARTSGTTQFNGNIVLSRSNTGTLIFGLSGGSSTLADTKTITCNTTGWIEFYNFTQVGTTAQVLNASSVSGGTIGCLRFYSGNIFNGPLTASGYYLNINGGTFNNTTSLSKTGGGDNGSNGTLVFNGATTISNSNGAAAKISLAGTITLTNTLTLTGSTRIQVDATITNGGNLITVNNTGSIDMNGIISGSGGITKLGSGTLSLTAANTYTGTTTISSGYLTIGNTTALGNVSGGTVVESGGTLDLSGITYASAEPLTINGTGYASDGAIRNSSGTGATFPGLVTLAANSSIYGGSGTITLSNAGTITGSGYTLTLGGTIGGTITSIIGTDAGGLTKVTSAGTWTLNGANTYTGTTTITSGILKLGNTSALGTNATGTTISSGGALDLNGYVLSSAEALTISGTGVSSGGALINTGAATSFSGDVTLGAATTINTANDITLSGTISPNTYTLSKAGANSLIMGSNTVTINGLTISAGTFNAGSSTINLSGTFTNSGTFTCGTGTVNFVGSAAQTIPALTYYNLTLNNTTSPSTSAATLAGNISVGGTLTLTTGILNTSTYTIDLGANGSISESNPSVLAPTSYVTGYVSATRNTGSTSGTVTFGGLGLEITETTQTDNSTVVTRRTGTASSGNSKSSILRYFDITPTIDAGLNGTLVFRYTTAEIASHTEANLKLYKSDSPYTAWTKQGTSSVDASTNTVTLTGITDFSRWTASDQVSQPLPVNFLNFSVKSESGINKLTWSTASELNNDYFEIERSNNGIDFTIIDKIKGEGTVNTISEYVYFDSISNQNSSSYYRLKQVDFDKNHSYSSIINSKLTDKFQQFSIYPNPFKYGDILHVRLNNVSSESESIQITILDLSGKLMLQNEFQNINNQYATQLINQNNTLNKGIYLIEFKTLNNKYIERLEVE